MDILYELLLEYILYFLLDFWAKHALRNAKSVEECLYIWSSEVELLLTVSLILWFLTGICPILLLLLAYMTYIFSKGWTLKYGLLETVRYLKSIFLYIIYTLWNIIYEVWFACSVNLGIIIARIFQKVFGDDIRRREATLETFFMSIGKLVNLIVSNISGIIVNLYNMLHKSVLFWKEIFRNSPWEIYSNLSPDSIPSMPAYFTNTFPNRDQLLCHPECELSQRSGIYSTPDTHTDSSFDNPRHDISASTQNSSNKANQTTIRCKALTKELIISYIISFSSHLVYILIELSKNVFYLSVPKTHTNQLLPPGLKNMGQNTCYFNAVLQCFVRTPGIVGTLETSLAAEALVRLRITEVEAQFLHSFRELMLQLSTWTMSDKVLEEFRFYCNHLEPNLVSYMQPNPVQQDAAEFVMWLLNKLHECFNMKRDHNYVSSRIRLKRFPILLGFDCGYLAWKAYEYKNFTLTHLPDHTVKRLLQLADEEWEGYEQNNSSPVSDIFTSQTVEVHQCLGCHQLSAQTQIFTMLPLAFPSDCEEVSLSNLVKQFFSVEEVDVNDSMQCTCVMKYNRVNSFTPIGNNKSSLHTSKIDDGQIVTTVNPIHFSVKTSTPVSQIDTASKVNTNSSTLYQLLSPIGNILQSPIPTNDEFCSPFRHDLSQKTPYKKWIKQTFLCKAPKCLVMHLLRFQYDSNKHLSVKTHQSVDIPLSNFDIPVLASAKKNGPNKNNPTSICNIEYELYGLILHVGIQSTASGHYIAYSCDRDRSKQTVWYKFNDETVTKVDASHEFSTAYVKRNAYMLFYRQKNYQC